MKKFSIVTTLFKSERYIEEFYQRVTNEAKKLCDHDYEIIFVNDGSPDQSLQLVVDLAKVDSHIVLIDLSRNFGHHQAMMTGLSFSTGKFVFLIDSDLEEMPEWMSTFYAKISETKCDVVFGAQDTRKGGYLERITGAIFYRAFRFFTNLNQQNNITTARLMSKRYVKALLSHQEREINIGGLWALTGFQQIPVIVKKKSNSPTTYSFFRKVDLFINAVISFSALPLAFIFYSGILISSTALLYIIFLVIRYYFYMKSPAGYLSIVASVWLFSGLIILFLGILGGYIAKIFSEVKCRPNTIIKDIYRDKERLEFE